MCTVTVHYVVLQHSYGRLRTHENRFMSQKWGTGLARYTRLILFALQAGACIVELVIRTACGLQTTLNYTAVSMYAHKFQYMPYE